jgi:hypothetical protein
MYRPYILHKYNTTDREKCREKYFNSRKRLKRCIREVEYTCLVVRVQGYRTRGPGFDSGASRFFQSGSGSGTGSTQPPEHK